MPAAAPIDTGSVTTDLMAYADILVTTFTRTPAAQVLPGLVAAMAADRKLAAAYRDLLIHPLRQRMREAVELVLARFGTGQPHHTPAGGA